MEDTRRFPKSDEIDDCFRVLLGNQIVTVPNLCFLMNTFYKSKECAEPVKRKRLLDEIVLRMIEVVKEGYLTRWDFDPWDNRRDTQLLSGVPECNQESEDWILETKKKSKNGLLSLIIIEYKQACRERVYPIIERFRGAVDCDEVFEILDEAIELGIIKKIDSRIMHNHSIIDSKKAFEAYAQAQDRIYFTKARV